MLCCPRPLALLAVFALSLAWFVASAAAAEGPRLVEGDPVGPRDAGVVAGVPGAFVVANVDLRDEQGRQLDPEPSLAVAQTPFGAVLAPDEDPASYGVVGTPAAGAVRAVLGRSIFDAFVIELVGRRAVDPYVTEGAASYEAAAPGGADVEVTVRAGELEEWIVVSEPGELRSFRYMIGASSDVRLTRLDASTLRGLSRGSSGATPPSTSTCASKMRASSRDANSRERCRVPSNHRTRHAVRPLGCRAEDGYERFVMLIVLPSTRERSTGLDPRRERGRIRSVGQARLPCSCPARVPTIAGSY